MQYVTYNRGFVRFIFLIVTILFVFAYFNIDLRGLIENTPVIKETALRVWGLSLRVWNGYLSEPLSYFWNTIVVEFFWHGFIETFGEVV